MSSFVPNMQKFYIIPACLFPETFNLDIKLGYTHYSTEDANFTDDIFSEKSLNY